MNTTNKNIREFTIGAILLGIILSLLMCAANTYLGLFAGMTVSASIPAAVISMGLLRGLFRRGTIHENNIVQTIASAGESLAAGIIFTIPALVIANVWNQFDYLTTFLVALLGGTLGILFMIPLRRALIIEEKELIFPEGVACSEVLKAGETGGSGMLCVFTGVLIGVVFKFLVKGISFVKETVEGAFRIGNSALYGGMDMSVALLGVGYIVGFNIALLVFIGGMISWVFGIPIYMIVHPVSEGPVLDSFWTLWSTQMRFMGVGAMVVGGIWSIVKVRHCLIRGVKEITSSYRTPAVQVINRADQDMPIKYIVFGMITVTVLVYLLYSFLTGSALIGFVSCCAMIVTAFFFVAVSSYIVGLVGSSNNPVSGMVIVTVIFSSVLLLLFRMTGTQGLIAALLIAGVVCCAACTAADVSQDLKTGYIIGATPRKQQYAQIIGVAAAAFIIAPILALLHKAYGIGTGEPGSLNAPQASLFASIVSSMFTGKTLPWTLVVIGAMIGIILIVADEILRSKGSKFRMHVMPVAVGIYLPLSLSIPIVIGGILNVLITSVTRRTKMKADVMHRGVLFSSGLIAGEAITGIGVALLIVIGLKLPWTLCDSVLLSVVLYALVILLFMYIATRCRNQK